MSRGDKQPELWSVLPVGEVTGARDAGMPEATITAAARKVEVALALWQPPPDETPCSPRWECEAGDEAEDRDETHVLPVCVGLECPWAAPAAWRNAVAYSRRGELLGATGWACARDGRLPAHPDNVCWPVLSGAQATPPGPRDEAQTFESSVRS